MNSGRRLEQLFGGSRSAGPASGRHAGRTGRLAATVARPAGRRRAQVLPRLGVFQGGAMEDDLLAITGLGSSGGGKADSSRPC